MCERESMYVKEKEIKGDIQLDNIKESVCEREGVCVYVKYE